MSPRHSPSKNWVGCLGVASAITHANRAFHGRGLPSSLPRSSAVRASCVGPRRAERRPGKPPSASTSTPESSPSAGRPERAVAVAAFRRAFSAYVSPTSSTPLSNATSSKPVSASSSRYSRSLPVLPVATTSRRCSAKRGDRPLLSEDQLFGSLVRQGEQRVQLGAGVGRAFGGGLELGELSGFGHDGGQGG